MLFTLKRPAGFPVALAVLFLCFSAVSTPASASDRAKRQSKPWSVGFNGGFYAGYHLNETFYFSAHHAPSLRFAFEEGISNDGKPYGQDGVDRDEFQFGEGSRVSLRIFPFDNGLFFGAGWASYAKTKRTVTFDKRDRKIGDNAYDTSMKIVAESQTFSGAVAETGYDYTFDSGLVLGIAFVVPRFRGEYEKEDIEVSGFSPGVSVSQSNIDKQKQKALDELNNPSVDEYVTLKIGYDF